MMFHTTQNMWLNLHCLYLAEKTPEFAKAEKLAEEACKHQVKPELCKYIPEKTFDKQTKAEKSEDNVTICFIF